MFSSLLLILWRRIALNSVHFCHTTITCHVLVNLFENIHDNKVNQRENFRQCYGHHWHFETNSTNVRLCTFMDLICVVR